MSKWIKELSSTMLVERHLNSKNNKNKFNKK